MRKHNIIFSLLGAGLALAACAQVGAPNGGLDDKTTPVFVATNPPAYTLNYKENSVSVTFNKYMDRNSVIENMAIMPTTPYTYDWYAKKLEIYFSEPLKPDLTYAITFGADMSDYYRIKAAESLDLVFATGSKIDSGKVTGKLFGERSAGMYVFAYSLTGVNPDTINPAKQVPDYKIQIGGAGTYSFNSMKDGKYRLFAVRDELKDGLINETTDLYASAGFDCKVENSVSAPVNFWKYRKYDKTPPRLFGAEAINNRLVRASFSETLKIDDFKPESFIVSDSIGRNFREVISAYVPNLQRGSIDLLLKTPLDSGIKYSLTFKDVSGVVKDSSDNWLKDTLQKVYFSASRDKENIKPNVEVWPCADSTLSIKRDSVFTVWFNTGIQDTTLKSAFTITRVKDSTLAPIKVVAKAANLVNIIPEKEFANGELYFITYKSKGLVSRSGVSAQDTIIKLRFVTADEGNNGSANGVLVDSTSIPGSKILVFEEKTGAAKYLVKPDEKGKWEIKSMRPGVYKLSAFSDINGDGIYESGYPYPFKPAAPFFIITKEIVVAPRWSQADVIINLKK